MQDPGSTHILKQRHHPLSAQLSLVILVFLLSLFINATPPVLAGETLTIGLVPEMNVFAQMERFRPLANYLIRETDITIKLFMLNRYSDVLERLQTFEIDAAFLGSYTAALAISKLNAQPVARPINLDNTSTYHGLIFVRKDSGIKVAQDMRGKTMAFVDMATTAGYIFPVAWLKKQGVNDISTFFSEYFFTGSHDGAIDAVLTGKADIGSAKNTIYELYLANNPNAKEQLTVIASSLPVPSNGLCVMPRVDEGTIAKLEAALLALDRTPEGKAVLKKLRAIRFIKTTVSDYQPVFDMAHDAGVELPTNK